LITLLTASESASACSIRAWTGIATDEGVGLISMVEVSDERGRPLCRYEVFLDAAHQRSNVTWPRNDASASRLLQQHAIELARDAVLRATLSELNGHRFDIEA
jgi:hypothetical protein